VDLADQQTFQPYFDSLVDPLSDYTFSQIYTWRNSLHIIWKILDGHLCVFANGSGDLTLLIPPIGDGGGDLALKQAFELMNNYNTSQGVPHRSRVEYASDELLARFDRSKLSLAPMGADYVYDIRRMIDLAGSDLSSKRQAKNRFLRLYQSRVETYDPAKHLDDCIALLQTWRTHQDAQHLEEPNTSAIKRQKETIATELALRSAGNDSLRGFTFGEYLGKDQSSITIEKTDLEIKGLAQYIFSEFCRRHWADRPLTNVGDDWGLQSLAWTKMSYRPVKLLQKYTVKQAPVISVSLAAPTIHPEPIVIRPATKEDLATTVELEKTCFNSEISLKKRQLQYLQQRSSALSLVAEQAGQVIGSGIALIRRQRRGPSGRIYSLAVDPNHRGHHTGRRLLQSMVEQLAQRGVKRIYLEVEQSNLFAIALYQRNGFRSIGTLPNYYRPGHDAIHMIFEVLPKSSLFEALSTALCQSSLA